MKKILVTGVGKGLGRAFLNHLTAESYFVYGLLRNENDYQDLIAQKTPNTTFILADVSNDDCMEAIKDIVKDDPIDLLINNAGIGGEGMYLDTATAGEIIDLLQVHCLGAWRVVKALKDNLLRAEDPVVLNLNSRLGSIHYQYNGVFRHLEASYAYRIAKAAQNMLTNCLRMEFEKRIRFISLTPGRLMTRIAQADANLTPEESAAAIISCWENGTLLSPNGILQVPDNVTPW